MVSYLLTKYDEDKSLAGYDAAILVYLQPAKITHQQHTDGLFAKGCTVADVYVDKTQEDIFIEGVDASICHSLVHYWAQNLQAELVDIEF